MKAKRNCFLPALLLVVFALTRWPGLMPDNFSAAYALVFCAAVYFPRHFGWWLPLLTIFVTDLFLNLHYGASVVSYKMIGTYLAYLGIVFLGRRFSPRSSFLGLLGGGILGAIVFYLVTNTICWLTDPAYAKTIAGWIQALTVGTPGWPHTWEFFRNTLLSGGLFAGLFAGAMKLSEAAEPEQEPAEEPADEPAEAEPEEAKA